MTQAAVSYQVKLLEDRVGAPLFLRQPRKVVLSEAGKRLAPAVAEAFQRLNVAFANLRETDENVLSVTAVNTVCTNWLVPRLGRFQMAHPNIAVRLEASPRMVDFTQEEFDIGIRGGKGDMAGPEGAHAVPGEPDRRCQPGLPEAPRADQEGRGSVRGGAARRQGRMLGSLVRRCRHRQDAAAQGRRRRDADAADAGQRGNRRAGHRAGDAGLVRCRPGGRAPGAGAADRLQPQRSGILAGLSARAGRMSRKSRRSATGCWPRSSRTAATRNARAPRLAIM